MRTGLPCAQEKVNAVTKVVLWRSSTLSISPWKQGGYKRRALVCQILRSLISSQSRPQPSRRRAHLRNGRNSAEFARKLDVVLAAREGIVNRRSALVDGREGAGADIKLRVHVVLDLDRVPRVFVGQGERVPGLRRDGRRWVQIEQALSERSCRDVVLGLIICLHQCHLPGVASKLYKPLSG